MNDFLDLFQDKVFLWGVMFFIIGELMYYTSKVFKDELVSKPLSLKDKIQNKQEKKKIDFADKLAKMYEESEKEQNTINYYKVRQAKLPIRYRLKIALRDLVTDDYLKYSSTFIIGAFITSSSIVALLGIIIIRNFLVIIPLTLIGFVFPYLIFKGQSTKAQLQVKERNIYILSTLIATYNTTPSLNGAFEQCLHLFPPGSDSRVICENVYKFMSSMPLPQAIKSFKRLLDADTEICRIIDVLVMAEEKHRCYKNSLEYYLERYNKILRKNREIQVCHSVFNKIYIIAIACGIGVIMYNRYIDVDRGPYLFTGVGSTLCAILFFAFFRFGLKHPNRMPFIELPVPNFLKGGDE